MYASRREFPYVMTTGGDPMPLLPITLKRSERAVSVSGVVDSGATANVLPYSVGVDLGGVWEAQRVRMSLGGAFRGIEARGLVVEGTVEGFRPVSLAFAWARTDEVSLLLGQTNFFAEFEVCVYRSRLTFTIDRKEG